MRESHIEVTRHARYFALGDSVRAAELWVVCHGYAQLARRFARHFTGLAEQGHAVLVPEALNRFYVDDPRRAAGPHGTDARIGATWMTREDREAEIADYVAYLDALVQRVLAARAPGAPHPRLTVLGFSQGTATVCRWMTLGRTRAERLVLCAGRVPPELHPLDADSPLRTMEIVLVSGDEDQLVTTAAMDEERDLLAKAGMRAARLRHPARHTMHPPTIAAIAGGTDGTGGTGGTDGEAEVSAP